VQLNDVLEAMLKMLRRLLGEHVVIDFRPSPHLPAVTADRGMLEQVVLNLCVNARDAMVRGGILQITTETVTIAPGSPLENRDARPGRFLRLTVTDSGCGMDDATLSRIFEPFFTTKEVGKGTGLGLATVFGIVKQHQGWVHARSVVGKGSTFLVYFPVEARGVAVPDETSPEPEASGGTETILLVEDDARVRRITATALRNKGYRVLEAPTGPEALAEWEKCGKQPDLLFSDMVMPAGMSGLELAERLRAQKPDLRVVLFSGYTADLLDIQGQRIKDFVYLAKPCSSLVLTRTVRECLDSRRNKAAAVHV
jgi:CheY-like chemotaxis protein